MSWFFRLGCLQGQQPKAQSPPPVLPPADEPIDKPVPTWSSSVGDSAVQVQESTTAAGHNDLETIDISSGSGSPARTGPEGESEGQRRGPRQITVTRTPPRSKSAAETSAASSSNPQQSTVDVHWYDHVPLIKYGWITKEGQFRKNWRERYFILDRGHFQYFESFERGAPSKGIGSKSKPILLKGFKIQTMQLDAHTEMLQLIGGKAYRLNLRFHSYVRLTWEESLMMLEWLD
jgi:hypothetical protein